MLASAWDSLNDLLNTDERCDRPSCTDGVRKSSTVYPPDRAQIGRANWKYVHTRASNYPDSPTEDQQNLEISWIRAFSFTYPCSICARDFVAICKRLPPVVLTKSLYQAWWKEVHNEVNRDLSKPVFRG